ncbi:hypothetical protein [Demequina aurantiaca]|uniref:hypothetical protein n=1 Tax=Demequina aurantiaca TaxID=676200 RepID=UPI003D325272
MPLLGFSANATLNLWLLQRAERINSEVTTGTQAKVELGLWRGALRLELRRSQWTLNELAYLSALGCNSEMDDSVPTALTSLAGDAEPDLATKHNIDHDRMTVRLAQLGPVQDRALREALTRFRLERHTPDLDGWSRVGVHSDVETVDTA